MHFPTKDIEIMDVFYININCLMATPVNSFVILICGSTRFEITSFYMNIRHILEKILVNSKTYTYIHIKSHILFSVFSENSANSVIPSTKEADFVL